MSVISVRSPSKAARSFCLVTARLLVDSSEAQRQLHARAFERREDAAHAADALETAALLADEELDVRVLGEFVDAAEAQIQPRRVIDAEELHVRREIARRILEALRDDPVRRDAEARVVLAF